MDPNDNRAGKIDDILRGLKPKNVTIPTKPAADKSDLMPDFKAGGIDAVLGALKPKATARSAPVDSQRPCERCGFDLTDLDPGYSDDNILCPSCREETNIGLPTSAPLAKNCMECGFDLDQMYAGYAATNTMCSSCREKNRVGSSTGKEASTKAGKQREQLARFEQKEWCHEATKSVGEEVAEPVASAPPAEAEPMISEWFSSQQLPFRPPRQRRFVPGNDTWSNIARTGSTTRGLRRHIEKMDLIDNSIVDIPSMTPRAKLEFRKHHEYMKIEVGKRMKEQGNELEEMKKKLADAEAKMAAKKAAEGNGTRE